MINNSITKKKLVSLRIDRGLTQKEAAQGMDIPQNALSMYESGARMPRIDNAQKIADFYGVPIEQIDFSGWRK